MTRLEKSLKILRDVNQARLASARNVRRTGEPLRGFLELGASVLEQHDADCRAKLDARQLSIFEGIAARATS